MTSQPQYARIISVQSDPVPVTPEMVTLISSQSVHLQRVLWLQMTLDVLFAIAVLFVGSWNFYAIATTVTGLLFALTTVIIGLRAAKRLSRSTLHLYSILTLSVLLAGALLAIVRSNIGNYDADGGEPDDSYAFPIPSATRHMSTFLLLALIGLGVVTIFCHVFTFILAIRLSFSIKRFPQAAQAAIPIIQSAAGARNVVAQLPMQQFSSLPQLTPPPPPPPQLPSAQPTPVLYMATPQGLVPVNVIPINYTQQQQQQQQPQQTTAPAAQKAALPTAALLDLQTSPVPDIPLPPAPLQPTAQTTQLYPQVK